MGKLKPLGGVFLHRSLTPVRASLALLLIQAALLLLSIPRNSVTFDEAQHLPAGISYWHHGRFFAYHQNPPLVKAACALPALAAGAVMNYSDYFYSPGSRHSDFLLGQYFMRDNRRTYQRVFVASRLVSAAFAVLCGRLIFNWGRELFGDAAGLLGQALWTFSPAALAHGGLVTPDVGAATLGFAASYLFWRYLKRPSPPRLLPSAIALGLAIGSKFTHVVLPGVWGVLAIAAYVRRVTATESPNGETDTPSSLSAERATCSSLQPASWTPSRIAVDALLLFFVSLLTLNLTYLYEESGRPLGRMHFFSALMTIPADAQEPTLLRTSRFDAEIWKWIPVPLPSHFVLGFDHQMADIDSGFFENYLRGTFRYGDGWWYYYLYAFLAKAPLGTLLLVALAGVACARLAFRGRAVEVAALLLPALAVWIAVSLNDRLNVHSRYILITFPYLFTAAGATMLLGNRHVQLWVRRLAVAAVVWNATSVLSAHPFYLSYFNEVAGGPRNGYKHLIDSNLDWGQGLLELQRWRVQHAPEQDIQLAYFGAVMPEIYGVEYSLPGTLSPSRLGPPRPGLHVVSANYVAGASFPPLEPGGGRSHFPKHGYSFYQLLQPVTTIADCLFVYSVTPGDLEMLRAKAAERLY